MMKEKSEVKSWIPTDSRFVAFLDLLGFKDKVVRLSHKEIYEELQKMSNIKKVIELHFTYENQNYVHIVNFSDSIILFSKDDSFETFEAFLFALSYLFSYAVREKIALKGGIAHGEISVNKSQQIYFGQPLIDAYLIEEDVNYLGVVGHSSIDKYIRNHHDRYNSSVYSKFLFQCKTNLKSGKITHWNLNWFDEVISNQEKDNNTMNKNNPIKDIRLYLEEFYTSVSRSPRRYIDHTIQMIEENKIEILNKLKVP